MIYRRSVQRHRPAGAAVARHLGFGRIVASDIGVPIRFENLESRGCAVVRSDNATEPCLHCAVPLLARDLPETNQPNASANQPNAWYHCHGCPGRKPPFWAVKRPALPYRIATQN